LKDSELGEKIKEFNTKVLELFEPDYVIASYSRPRTAGLPRNITSKYRVMANGLTVYENYAKEKGTRFFRTDNDRAVMIDSKDGKTLKFTTMAEILRKQKMKERHLKESDLELPKTTDTEDESERTKNAADDV